MLFAAAPILCNAETVFSAAEDDARKIASVKTRTLGRRFTDVKNFFTEVPREIFGEKLEKLISLIEDANNTWRYY